jgi:iron(III) transport system permease protein
MAAAPREHAPELWQSAKLGTAAATAALVFGLPLAWSLREARRVPWGRLGALALCLAVPGPLLGIGLIWFLNQPPGSPLAGLAWLYDTNFAPWLVQTLRALPLVTLVLWAALATVPQVMLDVATTDRAGWWRRLLVIAVPQRWPAVAAAWVVGLAVAVGELAATVLVVPPGPTTLSVRIFSLLHYGVDDRVAAICLDVILAIALLTWVCTWLLRAARNSA